MRSFDLWIKVLHIVAVLSWMAAMLYLPRLFVYHADAERKSPISEHFKIMERRLLKGIVNPAMIAVWITGPLLAWREDYFLSPWLIAKLALVLLYLWLDRLWWNPGRTRREPRDNPARRFAATFRRVVKPT